MLDKKALRGWRQAHFKRRELQLNLIDSTTCLNTYLFILLFKNESSCTIIIIINNGAG